MFTVYLDIFTRLMMVLFFGFTVFERDLFEDTTSRKSSTEKLIPRTLLSSDGFLSLLNPFENQTSEISRRQTDIHT